jgi:hypothetical protein
MEEREDLGIEIMWFILGAGADRTKFSCKDVINN